MYPVAINGKTRTELPFALDASQSSIEKEVLADATVIKWLEGKTPKKIVFVKGLCRRANVEKVDAGPKGVVISFRNNIFANPAALIRSIAEEGTFAKIRPDQRVVFIRGWEKAEERLKGVAAILTRLVRLAETEQKAA